MELFFKKLQLLIFILSSISIFGQTQTDMSALYPIDRKLQECLDSIENQTTTGMMNCEGRAHDLWEKELNKSYVLLMQILTQDEKEKLESTQRNWQMFKGSEFEFVGAAFYNQEGTIWHVITAGRQMEIVRQRAIELKTYYDMLIDTK